MDLQVTLNSKAFRASLDDTRDRYDQAISVAKNMIASMMEREVKADVAGAGNFSADSVTVSVDGDTITTSVNVPGADIFETGGTIYGKPLLWLPLSGTDAEGVQASNYGDKLFSVNRPSGGVPLLFSTRDRSPKYFGVPSVTIPQKFHLSEIQNRVMDQLDEIFERALDV